VKKVTMGFENVPVGLTNSVPTFAMIDGRKVKWAMNVRVQMGEVDVLLKGKEVMATSVGF
jgi:hypothetical protein